MSKKYENESKMGKLSEVYMDVNSYCNSSSSVLRIAFDVLINNLKDPYGFKNRKDFEIKDVMRASTGVSDLEYQH